MHSDTHIPLLPVDICIPVQEFRADYTIVQNNHLPIVREFVLRLLELNNFTKDQLGKFLGFSEKETTVALNQLVNLDEVAVNEHAKFQLTSKSKAYFSAQHENRPMIQSLEEMGKRLKFELLTYSYVNSKEQLGNPLSSVRLLPNKESISNSAKKAKNAFQRYFHQIHEEEKFGSKVKNPELYKVSSFKKQSERYQRFNQIYGADTETGSFDPLLNHDFLETEDVVTNLSNYFRDLKPRDNTGDISRFFDSLGFDYGVSALKSGSIDVADYSIQSKTSHVNDDELKPIIGSILFEDNWNTLLGAIDNAAKISVKNEPVEVTWIAPSESYWAASDQQSSRFHGLKNNTDASLQVYLPIPFRKDKKVSNGFINQFSSIKNSLNGFLEGYLTGKEEVIFVGTEAVFVFCYLYQGENMLPIPVGFHTDNKKVVNSLASNWSSYLTTLDEDFEPKDLGQLVKAKK